jgi:hypothetical protein
MRDLSILMGKEINGRFKYFNGTKKVEPYLNAENIGSLIVCRRVNCG